MPSAAAKRSTIAAAGSTAVMLPTLWPAYIAIASMSPSTPASGGSDAYRSVPLPTSSPSPGCSPDGGLPAASQRLYVPMRRRRPAHVKQLGQHGVASFGSEQARLVARMRVALVAGHEPGAHHHSHRASSERGTRGRRIAGNQVRTKPERERHDRRALLNRHLEPLVLLEIEHQIHAKRTVRNPRDLADPVAQDPRLRPRCAQRSQAPRP